MRKITKPYGFIIVSILTLFYLIFIAFITYKIWYPTPTINTSIFWLISILLWELFEDLFLSKLYLE